MVQSNNYDQESDMGDDTGKKISSFSVVKNDQKSVQCSLMSTELFESSFDSLSNLSEALVKQN